MRRIQLLPVIFALAFLYAPISGQVADSSHPTPEQVASRDALLKPGIEDMKRGDAAAAYAAFQPALAAFPDDFEVLRDTASAAAEANQSEKALELFNRALTKHPAQPWPLRLSVLQLEAKLNRWADFDRDLTTLRAAKKSGDDHQLDSSNGFLIDEFDAGATHVQAVVFPLLAGRFHTLYRFLLPTPPQPSQDPGADASAKPDPCKNPHFRPFLDVESDDIDQVSFKKMHPDLAAKGERSYSLDTYGAPCSQGLIKFYSDGEPSYRSVRADVIKALTATPASTPPKP